MDKKCKFYNKGFWKTVKQSLFDKIIATDKINLSQNG